MQLYDRIMTNGLYSVKSETYFAWQGCDVCLERTGKTLGTDVVDAAGYETLEAARGPVDNKYEFRVCDGCLNAYANGEDFGD